VAATLDAAGTTTKAGGELAAALRLSLDCTTRTLFVTAGLGQRFVY